jgi:hypothetical protein
VNASLFERLFTDLLNAKDAGIRSSLQGALIPLLEFYQPIDLATGGRLFELVTNLAFQVNIAAVHAYNVIYTPGQFNL